MIDIDSFSQNNDNISIYLLFVIICLVSFLIIGIILIFMLTTIGYIIFIYFKKKIFNYQINSFNKETQELLKKYEKKKIVNVFLLKKPIDTFFIYILFLFYNINISRFYHTSLILELEQEGPKKEKEKEKENNFKKWIHIEKNEGIYLKEDFFISNKTRIIPLKKIKEEITLLELIEKTKETMGFSKFYNWNILNNNCQLFVKHLLITLKQFSKKNKKIICQKNPFFIDENNFQFYLFDFLIQFFSFYNYF